METVGRAQGLEYDLVITDLIVGGKAGVLRDRRRLNVGLSRAKHGQWIIGTKDVIDKPKHGMLLKEFQSEILSYRWALDTPRKEIQSKYYKPGDLE